MIKNWNQIVDFQRDSPVGLPLTNEKAVSKQQQLRDERKREYNDFLNKKKVLFQCISALGTEHFFKCVNKMQMFSIPIFLLKISCSSLLFSIL